MRKNRLHLLLVLVLSTTGCQKTESAPAASEPPASPSAQTTASASTEPVPAWVHDVAIELGSALDPDGSLAVGKGANTFKAGDPVILSMDVAPAPANTTIKVVWVGPNEKKISEETKTTASGQKYLTFAATDTKSWATGDYHAEIWFGDRMVGQEEFKIA